MKHELERSRLLSHWLRRRTLLKGAAAAAISPLITPLAGLRHGPLSILQTPVKRIFIAPDDHTDLFWTADEETYHQAFIEMIDYYLDLADATASEPADHQSRWNCDGSYWVWTYEKAKSADEFARLIGRIRDGHISVPLNALVVCLGGAPAEAVLRGMYYAGDLERRHNLRLPLAIAMENQTLPYGLAALWAGAGAQYSWKGICNCDTQVTNAGDREHEVYWATGPDGSRVLMKWNSLSGNAPGVDFANQSMGGYAEARNPAAAVEYVDTDAQFKARYPYRVIGVFGRGWDDLQTLTDEFVTVAKAKTNANRQVVVSNEQDFFQEFAAAYGQDLPSVACSFGNEWDLYCAAMAEVSARVKRAVEKLRGAEALATLVQLHDADFMTGRQATRALAWMDLGLFWEHNWGVAGVPHMVQPRINWQRRLATEIEGYVDTLHADAANALGGMIQSSGANLRFFAFNPLSWSRSDHADLPYTGTDPVHVVDLSTGQETPSQIVTVAGQRYLRVLAQDVPPVGYKVFEVLPGAGSPFAAAATATGNTLENGFYRLTLADRGAIVSLVDKARANREFAQTVNGRAINDLGPGAGSLQVENAGPVSVTLAASGSEPLSHTTRVTLLRDSNRIVIDNEVNEGFDSVFTWGFGFAVSNPDVWHEEVGAVIRAKLLDAGGHYAPRNARYDWLTLNHFADMTGGGVGVTLSNADGYFMQLGNSTPGALDTVTPQISALVGGRVGGSGTYGIPNQGDETHFVQRFALQTHDAYDTVAAMRFALEHQNPLLTGVVTGGDIYPEDSYSLLTISNPNVLLWALKPADDGTDNRIIARVWNLDDSPATFALALTNGSVANAKRTTHIETEIADAATGNGALTESVAAHQMTTYSFTVSGTAPTPTPTPTQRTLYVPLVSGWNLLSIPLVPPDASPDAVFDSIAGLYDVVYTYNDGMWKGYAPGRVPMQHRLDNIAVGQGYWLYMRQAAQLVVTGTAPVARSIDLTSGWNLVGYPSQVPLAPLQAFAALGDCLARALTYEAGVWLHFVYGDMSAPFALQPGKAYWLLVNRPCAWAVPVS